VALPTRRRLVKVLLVAIIVVNIYVLTKVSAKGWRFGGASLAQSRNIHVVVTWVAWTIILICVSIIPVTDFFRDWHWIRHWKQASFESSGDNVMVWLSSLQTKWGADRMITTLVKQESTRAAIRTLPSMSELQRVLEWVKELPQPRRSRMKPDVLATMPAHVSPHTDEWIRQYDRRHPGRLYWIANSYGTAVSDYVIAVNQLALTSGISVPGTV
jgi:hypothetical protein